MRPWWFLTLIAIPLPLSAATPTDTQGYGRVFFTPQDRALLDDARRRKVRDVPKVSAPRPTAVVAPAPPKPERPSGNVTLNGIVRRSDGEATVWVNGVAMPADAQTGKVQVSPTTIQSGVIRIPNSDSAGNVELKVGQKLDLSSGSVTERYANRNAPRAVPAAPRPPEPRAARRPPRPEQDPTEAQ